MLIILSIILLLILWIILAPIELFLDTRIPIVYLRIVSIGIASVQFREGELWLSIRVFFMQFHWRIQDLSKKEKISTTKPVRKKNSKGGKVLTRVLRVLKSLRIRTFELRLKPQDYTVAGQLYPLNFIPLPGPCKLSVSFSEEAYLLLRTTTAPWRIALALIKK